MKKRIIVGIIILTLGVILILFGFLLKTHQSNNESTSNKNEIKNNIYKDKEIIIFDFKEIESDQDLKVTFTIYNNTNTTLQNFPIFLDYYEGKEKIYTSENFIEKLAAKEELKITSKSLVFLYDKITDRKFRFRNIDIPVITKEEYLKEYGSLDYNQMKINN